MPEHGNGGKAKEPSFTLLFILFKGAAGRPNVKVDPSHILQARKGLRRGNFRWRRAEETRRFVGNCRRSRGDTHRRNLQLGVGGLAITAQRSIDPGSLSTRYPSRHILE